MNLSKVPTCKICGSRAHDCMQLTCIHANMKSTVSVFDVILQETIDLLRPQSPEHSFITTTISPCSPEQRTIEVVALHVIKEMVTRVCFVSYICALYMRQWRDNRRRGESGERGERGKGRERRGLQLVPLGCFVMVKKKPTAVAARRRRRSVLRNPGGVPGCFIPWTVWTSRGSPTVAATWRGSKHGQTMGSSFKGIIWSQKREKPVSFFGGQRYS